MGEVSLAIKLDEDLSHIRVNFMVGESLGWWHAPYGCMLALKSWQPLGARSGGEKWRNVRLTLKWIPTVFPSTNSCKLL